MMNKMFLLKIKMRKCGVLFSGRVQFRFKYNNTLHVFKFDTLQVHLILKFLNPTSDDFTS